MADRVGQQLGNYRVVRLIGQGGFAEVYLGEHVYLDTQAAIKVLHAQLSPGDIEQFRLEAKRVAYLEHPHIVRVLDFGVAGSTPFLVMSYAPNGTLRQRHAKGVRLPINTAVQYVKQIADALQYAHEEKFIHRDVKPENMLIGRRNEVLLSDFGIATIVHSTTSLSVQAAVGTIPYMAPEQLQEHPRPASDQYSLAVVVYEWLSGNRPFEGSFTEVVVKHLTMPPPPLREKIATISPEVEQVVLTALAKDPKQRFATIQAFANALEQASQIPPGQSIPSRGTLEPTERALSAQSSSIPTPSSVPISQAPLPPTELVTPPSQASLPPTELVTPSGPRSTVTPPSRPQQQSFVTTPSAPVAAPVAGVNLAPLGLAALAFALFILSALNAGLFSWATLYTSLPPLFAFGGLAMLIAGVQALRAGNAFSATAFCSYAAFWFTVGFFIWQHFKYSFDALAYFLLGWTIFTFLMFLGTLKSNLVQRVLFAFLFLTFLSSTIAYFALLSIGTSLLNISGYLGMFTAVIAVVAAWYSATHRSEFVTATKVNRGLINPIPLGLSAFALTTFFASLLNAHFNLFGFEILIGLAIFYGGLVQLIAGVQALRTGSTFGAVAFCSYGVYWLFWGLGVWQHQITSVMVGYLLVALTILYVWVFILALKTNIALILVSFFALLGFLTLAIVLLSSSGGFTWTQIGGWLGLITAVLAWYTALALLLSEMRGLFLLPVGQRGRPTV